MSRRREERETCVLVNDAGQATVWSTSPVQIRRLTRRLGEPQFEGGLARWDLPTHVLTWLPRLSHRKPRNTENGQLSAPTQAASP
jgi:hypothetical protein